MSGWWFVIIGSSCSGSSTAWQNGAEMNQTNRQPRQLSASRQRWVTEQESFIAQEAAEARRLAQEGRLEEMTRDLLPIRERLQRAGYLE